MDRERLLTAAKTGLSIVLRVLSAVVLIGVAIAVGRVVGDFVGRTFVTVEDQRTLAAFLGAGFLLASVEKLLALFPGVLQWIRNGDFSGLYTFSSLAFTLFLSLGAAAWVAIGEKPDDKTTATAGSDRAGSRLGSPIAMSNSVVFVSAQAEQPPAPSGTESFFMVPFFKEAGGCSQQDALFQEGNKLDKDTKAFIRNIAEGLVHCARPHKPVKLIARGFASSQPFEGCDKKGETIVSDRLNKQIANVRAMTVAEAFEAAVVKAREKFPTLEGSVVVTVEPWSSVEEMYDRVRFNDRNAGEYSSGRAVLTRRVEVVVADAGDCRVLTANPVTAASSANKSTESKGADFAETRPPAG